MLCSHVNRVRGWGTFARSLFKCQPLAQDRVTARNDSLASVHANALGRRRATRWTYRTCHGRAGLGDRRRRSRRLLLFRSRSVEQRSAARHINEIHRAMSRAGTQWSRGGRDRARVPAPARTTNAGRWIEPAAQARNQRHAVRRGVLGSRRPGADGRQASLERHQPRQIRRSPARDFASATGPAPGRTNRLHQGTGRRLVRLCVLSLRRCHTDSVGSIRISEDLIEVWVEPAVQVVGPGVGAGVPSIPSTGSGSPDGTTCSTPALTDSTRT